MDIFPKFLIVLMIGLVCGSDMLVLTAIHKHNAKKCKYDCEKCKNWDCMKLECDRKRKELSGGD